MEKIENLIIEKLTELRHNGKDSQKRIANYMLERIKAKKFIPKIHKLSKILNISPATLTRFVQKLNMNYSTLTHILEMRINNAMESPDSEDVAKNSTSYAASLIKKARKVYFWGISGSKLVNEDMNTKFMRMDINTVFTDNIEDQIGLAKLATEKDVLILTSFSGNLRFLEHLNKIKAKKIVITGNKQSKLIKNADCLLLCGKGLKDSISIRIATNYERVQALFFVDAIMEELLSDQSFMDKNIKSLY